jgi:pyruvate formate lyase activating enzyme
MMQEAVLYEKLDRDLVRCTACRWYCKVPKGATGVCGVRINEDGVLYLMVYGKAAALHVDPIEKKPLFHFLPGTKILSLGTLGCNFGCEFCQNSLMSQTPKLERLKDPTHQKAAIERLIDEQSEDVSPQQVVEAAIASGAPAIAFTYNEPSVFVEYAHDIAVLAKARGVRTVFVSSGYETKENLDYMGPHLDAVNVDLKAFSEGFYHDLCHAKLSEVLEGITDMLRRRIWVEITTLVIPGRNDSDAELESAAKWIAARSLDIPWHLTAFHPDYRMKDTPPTPAAALLRARTIGRRAGLRYVYTGNIPGLEGESTHCPGCDTTLVERHGMATYENRLKNGACPQCGTTIAGVWR